MPDADVEPEPCRDCMTPIPPGWGWCQECEQRRKECSCCGEPFTAVPPEGEVVCACEWEGCNENCPVVGYLYADG